jgi:hypothetical protein
MPINNIKCATKLRGYNTWNSSILSCHRANMSKCRSVRSNGWSNPSITSEYESILSFCSRSRANSSIRIFKSTISIWQSYSMLININNMPLVIMSQSF